MGSSIPDPQAGLPRGGFVSLHGEQTVLLRLLPSLPFPPSPTQTAQN